MKKRLVFIYGNEYNEVGTLEWATEGHMNMRTFDPVATFNTAAKQHNLEDVNLIYVFYPEGNPGLMKFTEDVDNTPGELHRLSRVTEFQSVAGFLPVEVAA